MFSMFYNFLQAVTQTLKVLVELIRLVLEHHNHFLERGQRVQVLGPSQTPSQVQALVLPSLFSELDRGSAKNPNRTIPRNLNRFSESKPDLELNQSRSVSVHLNLSSELKPDLVLSQNKLVSEHLSHFLAQILVSGPGFLPSKQTSGKSMTVKSDLLPDIQLADQGLWLRKQKKSRNQKSNW